MAVSSLRSKQILYSIVINLVLRSGKVKRLFDCILALVEYDGAEGAS